MRWPWVSREVANVIERRRVDTVDRLREMTDRYDSLLKLYTELRLAGGNPAVVGLKPQPAPSLASDLAIEDVIQAKRGGIALRRQLEKFQTEQRRENVDEDEIAHRISYWKDPDGDEE